MCWLAKSLAVFSSAALAVLVSAGSSAAFDAGGVQTDPQATETLDSEAAVTRLEWKRRVDQSKIRAKQSGMLARAGLLKSIPRSADDIAIEASASVLNDQELRPGDIVSTVNGLFVYQGRYGSDPEPGDFVPVPPNFLDRVR
jgi:hypothetical protein